MKTRLAVAIAAFSLVGVAACNRRPAAEHPISTIPVKSIPQLSPAAAKGRIFLTNDQVKQALASGAVDRPIKSLLAVKGPLAYGDYDWNDTAIPDGPTWIRIDLGTQLMSVFRDGHEIGTAVIVYGGDNKETPTGKLHILAKAEKHRSSIYDAKMPYTLRLTNDGVSIHGSNVRWRAATHGCIGVPIAFAKRLFGATRTGDEVLILPASAPRGDGHTS